MSIFDLRDVRVAYDGRIVLDLSRLQIEKGLTYSLQGPNGAGKSTLLGILGLERDLPASFATQGRAGGAAPCHVQLQRTRKRGLWAGNSRGG